LYSAAKIGIAGPMRPEKNPTTGEEDESHARVKRPASIPVVSGEATKIFPY